MSGCTDGRAHHRLPLTPYLTNFSNGCVPFLYNLCQKSFTPNSAPLRFTLSPASLLRRSIRPVHTLIPFICTCLTRLEISAISPSPSAPFHAPPLQIYELMRSLNAGMSQKVPIIAVSDLQETSDSPCDTGHPAHLLEAEFPEGRPLGLVSRAAHSLSNATRHSTCMFGVYRS